MVSQAVEWGDLRKEGREMCSDKGISVFAAILGPKRAVVAIDGEVMNDKSRMWGATIIRFLCWLTVMACPLSVLAEETPWSRISDQVGELLQRGQAEEAIKRANDDVKHIEAKFGTVHPELAIVLSQLGRVYQALNRFDEAAPQYERALKIRTTSFGTSHPAVAVSLLDLGDMYREAGKYAQAAPFYEQALSTMEKAKGRNHQDVAAVLHNYSMLRSFQGRDAEAEALIKRAIAIRETDQGSDSYSLVGSVALLGKIYEQSGKYSEARASYEKAFTILKNRGYGEDYTAGMIAFAIGNLEYKNRNYQKAGKFYKESIRILEKVSGPQSAALGPILKGYADLLRTTNREADAKDVEARADALLKRYNQER